MCALKVAEILKKPEREVVWREVLLEEHPYDSRVSSSLSKLLVFHSCDDFDGLLLLLSLIASSRGNKDKICVVKSSVCKYLKVGCNLRNGSTGSRKKFIKEVEVDQMMPNNGTLKVDFFFKGLVPGPLLNVLVLKRKIQDHFCGRFSYV